MNEVNDNKRDKIMDFYEEEEIRDTREVYTIEGQEKEGPNRIRVYDLNFIEQNKTELGQVKSEIIREYAKNRNKEVKVRQSLAKVKNN